MNYRGPRIPRWVFRLVGLLLATPFIWLGAAWIVNGRTPFVEGPASYAYGALALAAGAFLVHQTYRSS